MANAKIRIDFSKIETFRDFCRQLADQLGFDCGCHSRDAFHDRMRDINLGYHKNARLSQGETLRIGVFGFRAFSKRNPALARIVQEHLDRLNEEALTEGHGAPLYEFVSLPFLQANF
jgi:hypothetical protein